MTKPAPADSPAAAHHPPKLPRRPPPTYVPGQYDALLSIRKAPPIGEIASVELKVAMSGSGLMVRTSGRDGQSGPPKLIAEYPYYVDLRLPNGDEVSIEVRRYTRAELAAADEQIERELHIVKPTRTGVATMAVAAEGAPCACRAAELVPADLFAPGDGQ